MKLLCSECSNALAWEHKRGDRDAELVEKCKVCNPELSSHVLRFAAAMQAKLHQNPDKIGWMDLTNQECFEKIHDELQELLDAVVNQGSPDDDVVYEAADVGNFLCFLVENYKRRFGKGLCQDT